MVRSAFIAPLGFALALAASSYAYADWRVEQTSDPISDEITVAATTPTEGASFFIRCSNQERRLAVGVSTKEYLGSGTREVEYRVDAKPPVKKRWTYGSSIAFTYATPDEVSSRMAGGSTFAVRLYDYNGRSSTYVFDTEGTGAALEEVLSKCGAKSP